MISRRNLLGTSAGMLLELLLPSAKGRADDLPQNLDPILEVIRKRMTVPALGAIVVSRDKVIARGEAGVRKIGEEGSVSADSHWQLGSITKTFTATLAAILVERGKLSWDTTLRQIYPEHAKVMAPGVGDVTVRQIITHRSGMVRGDAFGWEGAPETNQRGLTLSQRRQRGVVLSLKGPLEFKPGEKTSYSNRAYNTLGAALEKVGGRPWEDMILQEIAKALGMTSVVFGEAALDDPRREPWPHVMEGQCWKAVPPVPRQMYGYHIFNSAGGLSLTLADFGRWMQAHMNGEANGGILSRDMFKALHTAADRGGVPAFGLGSHAMGRTLSHGGSNGRNSAQDIVFPDDGVGVFLAINGASPTPIPASHVVWNTLYASAFPGRWPHPSLKPPEPGPNGVIEGEALEFVRASGGTVDFQRFKGLSGEFQVWWIGAKDGDNLVLRLRVPRKGRYAVEGVFARNTDYGSATFALGPIRKRIEFRAEKLAWDTIPLGESTLETGNHDLTITAHGNTGQNGIGCHLGLDLLRLHLKQV